MRYNHYAVSYLINRETKEVIQENESRKKLRRIARKKYSKEYSEEKTYVIISGENLKDALNLFKNQTTEKTEDKPKALKADKSKKQADKKKDAPKTKKKTSLLEDVAEEQEKELTRINKKINKKNLK